MGKSKIKPVELAELFLDSEGIMYERVTTLSELMRHCRGTMNPSHLVGLRPNGYDVILFNIYDAVHWIYQVGLKRC